MRHFPASFIDSFCCNDETDLDERALPTHSGHNQANRTGPWVVERPREVGPTAFGPRAIRRLTDAGPYAARVGCPYQRQARVPVPPSWQGHPFGRLRACSGHACLHGQGCPCHIGPPVTHFPMSIIDGLICEDETGCQEFLTEATGSGSQRTQRKPLFSVSSVRSP